MPWLSARLRLQQCGKAEEANEMFRALDSDVARRREVLVQMEITNGNIQRLRSDLAILDDGDQVVMDRQHCGLESPQGRATAAQRIGVAFPPRREGYLGA